MNSKKLWVLLTLTVLMVGLLALANAENLSFAVVYNTNGLNLRTGASYSHQIIGNIKKGEWVEILQSYYPDSKWKHVRVVDTNQQGYVDSTYLNFGASTGSGGGNIGVVNNPIATSFLNLREYPSLNSRVLGIYYNGTTFEVLNSANGWYQVRLDGMTGYFASNYVKMIGNNTGNSSVAYVQSSNNKSLNFRKGPSITYPAINRFYNGQKVNVLLKGNDYWRVSVNGTVGFVASEFLSTYNAPDHGTPPVTPTSSGYVIVNNPNRGGYLNLRSSPSYSGTILSKNENGVRFEMVNYGLEWSKVYGKSSGKTGFMLTKYLKLYGVQGSPIRFVNNNGSFANLRQSPNMQSNIITKINSGEEVVVLVPENTWSKVQYGTRIGYIMNNFLR